MNSTIFDWGSVVSEFQARYGYNDADTVDVRPTASTPAQQATGVDSSNALSLTGETSAQEEPTPIDANDSLASRFTVQHEESIFQRNTSRRPSEERMPYFYTCKIKNWVFEFS